ncbi:MarR family winged helix-turn-helix transcriptional regulator [Nonomuraea sp. NPDC050022]|uniref:MarR family winged helix-turn-helix transcriptional regulator n=1 Tax=Nonomuraea sp. NPDC050022 TaxID=3364358 RepID=UPI003788EF6E
MMLAVNEAGTPRMGDLKDRLGVTGRSITSLVDGLEDEGLLRRRTDPADRRSIRLEITTKGREHHRPSSSKASRCRSATTAAPRPCPHRSARSAKPI